MEFEGGIERRDTGCVGGFIGMCSNMSRPTDKSSSEDPVRFNRAASWAVAAAISLFFTGAIVGTTIPVFAQDFSWPWEDPQPQPVPQEPVYTDPPPQGPDPQVGGRRPGAWRNPDDGWGADTQYGDGGLNDPYANRPQICLQLEQRMVQEAQRGAGARQRLPQIQTDLRKFRQEYRSNKSQLERRGCYEYFLFSKTLRRTKTCVRLSRAAEKARRRLSSLEAQRERITSSGRNSYQSDIIRALARNGCGESYTREARRRDRGLFNGFWQDSEGGRGYGNTYNSLPFATYRTMCVRLCDGFYFPVSFSTLPAHFPRDANVCQSKCAAPTQLFYYQNPGSSVDQMVAFRSSLPYKELKTAFQYRKQYVAGCSCKQTEYQPADDGLQSYPARQGQTGPQPATSASSVRRADGSEQPTFSPAR